VSSNPKATKRPVGVRVGPHQYRLVFDQAAMNAASAEHGERLVGRCDTEGLVIVVDPKLAPSQSAETLVHEVLHACMDLIGATEDINSDIEERLVRRLAPVVAQVLAANPKLVGWVQTSCA